MLCEARSVQWQVVPLYATNRRPLRSRFVRSALKGCAALLRCSMAFYGHSCLLQSESSCKLDVEMVVFRAKIVLEAKSRGTTIHIFSNLHSKPIQRFDNRKPDLTSNTWASETVVEGQRLCGFDTIKSPLRSNERRSRSNQGLLVRLLAARQPRYQP